jgi:hypothetical protein
MTRCVDILGIFKKDTYYATTARSGPCPAHTPQLIASPYARQSRRQYTIKPRLQPASCRRPGYPCFDKQWVCDWLVVACSRPLYFRWTTPSHRRQSKGARERCKYNRDRRSPSISGSRISNVSGTSAQKGKVFTVRIDPETCISRCRLCMLSDAPRVQKNGGEILCEPTTSWFFSVWDFQSLW